MSRGMHYLNVAKDGMADIPQSLYEPAKGIPSRIIAGEILENLQF